MTLATTETPNRPQQMTNWKAPVGNMDGLRSLLENEGLKRSIMDMLPKHITPERLLKTLLVAANRNPKLFECTKLSIIETINRAAELGLDLSGTLGEAYPVPYGNTCTLIIGYRGLEKLAWQSGEIASIDAEVVYQEDKFEFRKGTEVYVNWSPKLNGDRGPAVGAYACVTMKNGGKLARFLPVDEIEKVRKVSKSGGKGPWVEWWGEMARKTALRRVLKDAPLSTEKFVAAMEHEASDADFSEVIEANTGRKQLGTAAVMERLNAREPERILTPEEEAEANSIIEARAAQSRGDSQDIPPDDEPVHQQQADDDGLPPMPDHAHTSPDWINDLITQHKPAGYSSANEARKEFHAADVNSWPNLTAERRTEKYEQLVSGLYPWKKQQKNT